MWCLWSCICNQAFGSTERVASMEGTVIDLSFDQHCVRLNYCISFTTDVRQVTPGPQWLSASSLKQRFLAQIKWDMMLPSHHDVTLLAGRTYTSPHIDLEHVVHLPRIWIAFVSLFNLLGVSPSMYVCVRALVWSVMIRSFYFQVYG